MSRPEDMSIHNEENPYDVTFETNPGLDRVMRIIETTPVDWEKLRLLAKDSNLGPDELRGKLAELHLMFVLQKAKDELGVRLNTSPIDISRSTNNYIFKNHPGGRITANHKDRPKVHAGEYEGLIVIDGLPANIEIKLAPAGKINNRYLKTDNIKRLFTPLKEYFATDTFGCVLVTDSNSILSETLTKSNQYLFKRHGGRIIPLPVSTAEFHEVALSMKPLGRR